MTVTDDFNRANGAIGANYVNSLLGGSGLTVDSLKCRGPQTPDSGGYAHRVESFSPDHYSRITINFINASGNYGTGYLGPLLRSSGTGGSWAGYQLACRSDQVEFFAFWNGAANSALLGTYSGVTAGDVLELRVNGSNIEYWKNSSLVDTVAENANVPESGSAPGLAGYNGGNVGPTQNISLFEAGDVVAAGGQPTMRRWGAMPYIGGQGIGNKGSGRMWGRSREGLVVPRRLAA